MHDANNKEVDYLFHTICKPEFDRVQVEDLACKIWEKLKVPHGGNNQVKKERPTNWLFLSHDEPSRPFPLH
jgi:hypothetical protein